jgi:hypothetical protein
MDPNVKMDGASPTNTCTLPIIGAYPPLKVLRGGYAMQCDGSIQPKVGKIQVFFISTGDLRFLTDLSTFYGRKVRKFTAVNRPIYGRKQANLRRSIYGKSVQKKT